MVSYKTFAIARSSATHAATAHKIGLMDLHYSQPGTYSRRLLAREANMTRAHDITFQKAAIVALSYVQNVPRIQHPA